MQAQAPKVALMVLTVPIQTSIYCEAQSMAIVPNMYMIRRDPSDLKGDKDNVLRLATRHVFL